MSAININRSNFQEEVIHSDKPVLLDFWAPWCGPCRAIGPVVEEIAKERSDIKVGKINVDEQADLANKFQIRGVPTFLVIENGREIHRATGARSKSKLLELI